MNNQASRWISILAALTLTITGCESADDGGQNSDGVETDSGSDTTDSGDTSSSDSGTTDSGTDSTTEPTDWEVEAPWFMGQAIPVCEGATMPVLGEAECQPIGTSCGDGLWPADIPEAAEVRYVSPDGTGQGYSQDNPSGNLQLTINQIGSGGLVVLSKGEFTGPIIMRNGVSLLGTCTAETLIVSASLMDTTFYEEVPCDAGMECVDSLCQVGGEDVPHLTERTGGGCARDEFPTDDFFSDGNAIQCASLCGMLERPARPLLAIEDIGNLSLSNLTLRGPAAGLRLLNLTAPVVLEDLLIEDMIFMGIEAQAGPDASLDLNRVMIRRVTTQNNYYNSGSYRTPAGLIHWAGNLNANTFAVEGSAGAGVHVACEYAETTGTNWIIRNGEDAVPNPMGEQMTVARSDGIFLSGGSLTLDGYAAVNPGFTGFNSLYGGGTLDATNVWIYGAEGGTILFKIDAKLAKTVISHGLAVGLAVLGNTTTFEASDLVVRETQAAEGTCAPVSGYGVILVGGDTTLNRFEFIDNSVLGLLVADSAGMWELSTTLQGTPTLSATDGLITGNRIGVNIQSDTINIDSDFTRVSSYDNTAVDISLEDLPLPSFLESAPTDDAEADTDAVNDALEGLGPCDPGMRCLATTFAMHGICLPETMTDATIGEFDACNGCGECSGAFICSTGGDDGFCGRICAPSYIEEGPTGPTGEDCEVGFLGDGWCDPINNTLSCGWDLGDCCESTCVDAAYECGAQSAYDCRDPDAEDFGSGGGTGQVCDWTGMGDGDCNSPNNNQDCYWDNGDCCESTCVSNQYTCGNSGYTCDDPGANENGGVAYGYEDSYEPNDTLDTATTIQNQDVQTHSLPANDVDFVTFTLSEPADVAIMISAQGSSPSFNFTDDLGSPVSYFQEWSDAGVQVDVRPLAAGTYLIELTGWGWQGIPEYTVSINSSDASAPPPTGLSAAVNGDGEVVVSWDASSDAVSYRLYWGYYPTSPLTEAWNGETSLAPADTFETSYTIDGLTRGSSYDLWVTGIGADGNETAPSEPVQVVIPIAEDAFEPDNTPEAASTISIGDTQLHSIHTPDDEDYARLVITEVASLRITTSGLQGDTVLTLLDENQTQVAYNDDFFSQMSQIDAHNLEVGSYYVLVHSYGSNSMIASYDLSVDVIAPGSGPVDPSELPEGYCDNGMFCVPPFEGLVTPVDGVCAFGSGFEWIFCSLDSECGAGDACLLMPEGMGMCATPCTPTITRQECANAGGSVDEVSNGYCTASNNVAACGYDGGDCCESTCRGATCSQVELDCQDPNAP